MKKHTRWKTFKKKTKYGTLYNKIFFCDEIGYYKIIKIQYCKTYSKYVVNLDGTQWFEEKRATIITGSGIKYSIPFLWLFFNSVDGKTNEKLYDMWKRLGYEN